MSAELKAALISSFPPGVDKIVDWEDNPGKHLEAIANTVKQYGTDLVELATKETNPLSAVQNLPRYSRAIGLGSNTAGSLVQQRNRLVSRFRELGSTTTIPQIQAVMAPLLDYANPTDIVVIESDRAALRDAHTYHWTGSKSFTSSPATLYWRVMDDGQVSASGAQIDITLTHSDLSQVSVTLTSPESIAETVTGFAIGSASGDSFRIYFEAAIGGKVGGLMGGLWRLDILAFSGTGTITVADLFVEGVGLDELTYHEGRGSAVWHWGVMVEDDKLGPNADLVAARAAIQRIQYAARPGSLLRRSVGSGALPAGDYAAIPGDVNTIPNASLPGTA